ncbi:hypothetical protein OsJ_06377 [Oryza sativa Japonica Group]|uniref:Uncharacterized protein n=1 Tax=Oryza sativa subsp. japonica TaxID=39947 RepID=B9F561_ORYSJ|nr:hypothetical protein OsJ_06377 [Oryza sativa Japonica Group]
MENGGGDASAAAWRFGAANPGDGGGEVAEHPRAGVPGVRLPRQGRSAGPWRRSDTATPPRSRASARGPSATGALLVVVASGAHNSYAPAAGIAEACRYIVFLIRLLR